MDVIKECDVKNDVHPILMSECWSQFVCLILCAKPKYLANVMFQMCYICYNVNANLKLCESLLIYRTLSQ